MLYIHFLSSFTPTSVIETTYIELYSHKGVIQMHFNSSPQLT